MTPTTLILAALLILATAAAALFARMWWTLHVAFTRLVVHNRIDEVRDDLGVRLRDVRTALEAEIRNAPRRVA